MKKQEKIIVSAFTGILMCDFSDVHKYIEEKLGRQVWTHELADKRVWDEIEEKSKEDFLEICKQEETERKGEWIACSDRLPEQDGMYYITVRDSDGDIDAVPCLWSSGFWLSDKWGNKGFEVIAWIKIPEPYGGKS